MNDRQIRCFLESGSTLNFTKAAEKLFIPQSQVSRNIAALEKELGVELFERESTRKISLTEAGKVYFNLFRRFETELHRTMETMDTTHHELKLGYNAGWSLAPFLSDVLDLCRQQDPDFRVRLVCLQFSELVDGLENGRLDAVLSLEDYLQSKAEIHIERITSVKRQVLYSRKQFPDGVRDPAELRDATFFMADDARIRSAFSSLGYYFRPYKFIPKIQAVPNVETMIANVENGEGVALGDEWVSSIHMPGVEAVDLNFQSPVALAWPAGEPYREIRIFADALQKHFGGAR